MSDNTKLTKQELAEQLGVSRSSLYYRRKQPAKDEDLRLLIAAEMERNQDAGSRPIAFALGVSRKRIRRVMRKFGLKPARRPRSFRKAEDERQPEQNYPCVTRYWSPIQPNLLWVSDFTYIEFHGRWLYLATVMDGFTGEILASNVMTSRTTELIARTIQDAVKQQRRYPEWFHSDQGSQYTAEGITELLLSNGVRISMSPKSSPWRNAMQESFYGRFKTALGDVNRFEKLTEAVEYIYQQIHRFNHIRVKNRLKMPPAKFRDMWESKKTEQSLVLDDLSTGGAALELRLRLRSAPPMDKSAFSTTPYCHTG